MTNKIFVGKEVSQVFKNGELIESKGVSYDFDGKTLKVKKFDDGEKDEYKVKASKLGKILSQPISLMALDERLMK